MKKISKKQKFREWKRLLEKDMDYDWIYIIGILSYKLKRTRKCITKNKQLANTDKLTKLKYPLIYDLAPVPVDSHS